MVFCQARLCPRDEGRKLRSHSVQHHGASGLGWVKGSHSHCCCSSGKPRSAWDQATDVLTGRSEMLPSSKSGQNLPHGLMAKMGSELELAGLAMPSCFFREPL